MAGGSVMSETADVMLVADKWLAQHPQVQNIVDGLGKGVSAALWLKYAKTVGPMGLLTGLAVDYGYDKLVENFHLDTAKADFAAYLLSKDSDLNQEQAEILASAAIKVTKEAGRILTHKMAADSVQGIRKYFSEKAPTVPEVKLGEGVQGAPRIIENTEKFIEDALQTDKNGLSKVGRALQKHSSREGSCFEDIVFSHTDADKIGEKVLREILGANAKDIHFEFPKNGCIEIYDKITGRGISISRNKEFNGFREFKNIPK